jgi:hypothetical protein
MNRDVEEAYYGGEESKERTWLDVLLEHIKNKQYGKEEKLKKDVGV